MLRLKQAINDCNIQQKALAAATGFGKSQISQTLNTGKLPADADKFKGGVYRLIAKEDGLAEWLEARSLPSYALFETIPDTSSLKPPASSPPSASSPRPGLGMLITLMAGKAMIDGPSKTDMVHLARCAHFLVEQIHYYAGFAAPDSLAEATAILMGDDA